jgi:murein DD-endopeptidase MepM/ murein hydrolase activator NlpD
VRRAFALALAVPAAAAAPAAAQTAGGGGITYVATPEISKVTCLRKCASRKRPQGGSTVKITGSSLGAATEVVFLGSRGKGDDATTKVRAGSDKRLNARVPMGAVTGPVAVVSSEGTRSEPSKTIPILPAPPPEPNPTLTPVPGAAGSGALAMETGTSRTRAYIGARRAVTFSFRLALPAAVNVQVVSAVDGSVVKSWRRESVTPGEVQNVSWSGRVGRSAARPGRYMFRLEAEGVDGVLATSAQTPTFERDAFDLYDHVFPVRGRHDFGGANADFGSGRSGHSHQGHDVFARCGTPMVAARGGRVQFKQYHGAAGHYLVIDGDGTDVDYAYMHLAEASPFRPGDRVYTGQRIGSVGETGNARGCHLHFEMWAGPGWYDGGKPFDPLPSLRAWDGWS